MLFVSISAFGQGSVSLSFQYDNCTSNSQAGTYTVSGTHNGKPLYVKGSTSKIQWSGSRWELYTKNWQGNFTLTHYNSTNTYKLPCINWTASYGCFLPSISGDCVSPPTGNTIPGASVEEGAANLIINLESYFDDAQDGASGLTYTKQSTDGAFFTATINGSNQLVINFNDTGTGTSTITIRATDSEGDYAEMSFTVKASLPPPPGSIVIDFEDQGFTNGQNYGSGVYTEGNIKITYSAGNWFESAGGEGGTYGLSAESWSFELETVTIETVDGSELDFISFYFNADWDYIASIQGFKDANSTGTQYGPLSESITLDDAIFDNVDKIVITSGDWGFVDVFDNFVFLPAGPTTSVPSVTTSSISGIGQSNATMGGDVTDDGGANVIERGVVYNTSGNPTTSDNKVAIGTGTGIFSQLVTGLTVNTTYYVRAYAINSEGTSYGSVEQFSTVNNPISEYSSGTNTLPDTRFFGIKFTTPNTDPAYSMTGFTFLDNTGSNPSGAGKVYVFTSSPSGLLTPSDLPTYTMDLLGISDTWNGSVYGFSGGLNLDANTTYWVLTDTDGFEVGNDFSNPNNAIYATSSGNNYVNQLQTINYQVTGIAVSGTPTVTTTAISTFDASSATMGGDVTADGGASVTERGVVYATTTNPTTSDNKVQIGTGTGTFSQSVSGLTGSTTYYVRAYAINSGGTSYGSEESFTTLDDGRGGGGSSISASITVQTNIACNGAATGSLTVTASDGTANFNYAWSNGSTTSNTSSTTNTISSLVAGTYTVTITDANSNTSTASATITQPTTLVAAVAIDSNTTCNGFSDGGATASVTGGISPYSFAWNNFSTTAAIAGVTAGTYTVTVTDNNGCSDSESGSITEPAPVASPVIDQGDTTSFIVGDSVVISTVQQVGFTYNWYSPPVWDYVAMQGISSGSSNFTKFAVAPDGTPYLAFSDNDNSNKATVMKYHGGSWQLVGVAGFTSYSASNLSLTIASDGTPYLAFKGLGNKLSVMKFDGSNWQQVGASGFSAGSADYIDLAISSDDSLFVAFRQFTGMLPITTEVMKFDGNNWVSLNMGGYGESSGHQSLAVASDGTPYLAFSDNANASAATVVKYDGSAWSLVGNAGFSDGIAVFLSMAISSDDSIYVAYSDWANSNKASLMKFDGTNWKHVGNKAFSDGTVQNVNLRLTNNNTPFVAFKDNANSDKATVMKFDGTDWINHGANAFTAGAVDDLSLDISNTGEVYVAYVDKNISDKASVMSYGTNVFIESSDSIAVSEDDLYIIEAVNGSGCTSYASIYVYSYPDLIISAGVSSNVSCNGGNNGSASVAVSSGTSAYSYLWSSGDSTATVNGLVAGTYTVTVTDANTLSKTASVTITQPAILVAAAAIDSNVTCNGFSDGGATASATGGTTPYTYLWSNAATTASITGVVGGTYTVTITDANSCVAVASATITQPAALSVVAVVDSNVSCNGATDGGLTASVSGGSTPYNYDWSNSATTKSITGIQADNYTVTVQDANNCLAVGSATIVVSDITSPVVLTKNITRSLDQNGTVSITPSDVDDGSTDECAIAYTSVSPDSFTCLNVGMNTVTLSMTDVNGNSSSKTATVTVEDNAAPTVKARDVTIQLNSIGLATLIPSDIDDGSFDNCAIDHLSISKSEFDCHDAGVNTIVLTATDVNGNTSSDSAHVTIRDNIAPIANAKNITVQLDANGEAHFTAEDMDNGSSDNCAIVSKTVTPNSFDCNMGGYNMVTLTVTDAHGNSSSNTADVLVQDKMAPTALAKDITIQLDANGQASISAQDVDAGSSDNCAIGILTVSPNHFTCNEAGINTVIFTATDLHGNNSTKAVSVTVKDHIEPVMHCNDLDIYLDHHGNASVSVLMVDKGSSDNCAIDTMYLSKTEFSCIDLGVSTIDLTGVDPFHNESKCQAEISVFDTIAPVAKCASVEIYLSNTGTATITPAEVDAGSSDNCSIVDRSISVSEFDCQSLGQKTVTLAVMDIKGNTDSCTAAIYVLDTLRPSANIVNPTVYLDESGQVQVELPDVILDTWDNCAIDSMELSKDHFTCAEVGINQVSVMIRDIGGNEFTQMVAIEVLDTTAPVVVTKNIMAYLDKEGEAVITPAKIDGGSADNCSITGMSLDKSSFNCGDAGTNVVKLTVIDEHGNVASRSAKVTVTDTIAPQMQCPADITVCAANANGEKVAFDAPVATDNCGAVLTQVSGMLSGSKFPVGVTQVTFNAKDSHDNATECSFNVTVHHTAAIELGRDTTICDNGTVMLGINSQNYTGIQWSTGETTPAINVSTTGDYWVTAIDANGCAVTDTVKVTAQNCTSIGTPEAEHKINIMVYPNPTRDVIFIESQGKGDFETVEIFNTEGRIIKTKTLHLGASRVEISLGGFDTGFYFIRITDKNQQSHYQKIILSK